MTILASEVRIMTMTCPCGGTIDPVTAECDHGDPVEGLTADQISERAACVESDSFPCGRCSGCRAYRARSVLCDCYGDDRPYCHECRHNCSCHAITYAGPALVSHSSWCHCPACDDDRDRVAHLHDTCIRESCPYCLGTRSL